jgi:membrane-associated protease RseP (regulator of RpoE activity)
MADATDSKSVVRKGVWVRVPPRALLRGQPSGVTVLGVGTDNLTREPFWPEPRFKKRRLVWIAAVLAVAVVAVVVALVVSGGDDTSSIASENTQLVVDSVAATDDVSSAPADTAPASTPRSSAPSGAATRSTSPDTTATAVPGAILPAGTFAPAAQPIDVDCTLPFEPNEFLPLEPCQKGAAIERVQEALIGLGFDLDPDGFYGQDTATAVQGFQYVNDLPQTGIVDEVTWDRLGLNVGDI